MARRRLDPCTRNARKGDKILGSIIGTGLKLAKNSNSGCILVLMVIILLSIFASSCSNKTSRSPISGNENLKGETILADTLQIALNKADSIINSGELMHLETFEIGKIKNIFIDVEKVTTKKDTLSYINIKKDCGNDYYYSWENKIILYGEIKYYTEALNAMQNNTDRIVTHKERYGYSTKSGITTLLVNDNNNKGWQFAIKFRNGENGTEYLSYKHIEELKSLLEKCIHKIDEIK